MRFEAIYKTKSGRTEKRVIEALTLAAAGRLGMSTAGNGWRFIFVKQAGEAVK